MYNPLDEFLVENNILYQKQFGFQNADSTGYAILQLVNQITDAFSPGKYAPVIFIDLSQAFNTVNLQLIFY